MQVGSSQTLPQAAAVGTRVATTVTGSLANARSIASPGQDPDRFVEEGYLHAPTLVPIHALPRDEPRMLGLPDGRTQSSHQSNRHDPMISLTSALPTPFPQLQ
jgi:hypothetical protein